MTKFAKPQTDIPRDRWLRPLVKPPTGGEKRVAYTRCTTFVGALEDTYKLGQWQQRHAIRGVALHDDLIAAVRDTDPNDKATLDGLVDEAKERSGAGDAARLGTYLHSVTEAADRGEDPANVPPPQQSTGVLDPLDHLPDLAAYLDATSELKHIMIEQFMVQDPLKVGGTPDRVVRFEGKRYIADLKTGSIEYGGLKIAAQLAMYARSRPYNVDTDERMDPHGAELDRGIVIHLPAGTGVCTLYWVDLHAGWEAVRMSRDVRQQRSISFKQLYRPLVTGSPVVPAPPLTLADQIVLAVHPDQVRSLWREHASEWTDDLTELAKQHLAELAVRDGQPVLEAPATAPAPAPEGAPA